MTRSMPPIPLVAAMPELAEEFARRTTVLAAQAIAARGIFSLAIPGGSVASAFLPVLAAAGVDWRRVHLFWCDERCVPPDDPASNYALARALWLDDRPADAPVVHRLPGDAPDATSAAVAASRELEQVLGDPPVLDLVLLGVGEDGHVASLFPGGAALEERARSVVAVDHAPKPPPRRLTLTMPVITDARSLCIAAFGASKRDVVREVLQEFGSSLPVARVLRESAAPWLMLDQSAALTSTRLS